MSHAIQIVGQQVPDDFAQTLRDVQRDQIERLSRLLLVANEAGWTLTALAEPLGVTREAVRIRIKRSDHPRHLPAPDVEVPLPPLKPKSKTEIEREAAAERGRNRELHPCGTRAAYARHIYRGEEPDKACRQAASDSYREERKIHSRARQRAMTALKHIQPAVFEELYAAEQQRERDPLDQAAKDRARQRALGALTREFPAEWEPLFSAEFAREQGEVMAS